MVESNITRATSKKIKESTGASGNKDKLEDIAITNALIPSDGQADIVRAQESIAKQAHGGPGQAHSGTSQAHTGISQAQSDFSQAHSGNVHEHSNDEIRAGDVLYSSITDISESRRDRAHAAMHIPIPLDKNHSETRNDRAQVAVNVPGEAEEIVVDRSPAIISSSVSSTLMNERQEMWNRATAAQDAGDTALAEMLFKAIGAITSQRFTVQETPRASNVAEPFAVPKYNGLTGVTYHPPQLIQHADTSSHSAAKKFFLTKGDLVYAIGSVTNHNSVGFAPFLDENIRKLRSPLPLTIFNRKWQQRAMAHHLDRRQRSDESSNDKDKSGGYKGFAFIQEWTQTYAQWTQNHRAFRKTLHDVYKIIEFSKLLGTHKNNCDDITEEFGFMVAFRYDMEVRNNTFSHRITDEDVKNAIPDISQRKDSVVEQCYNQCRNFGELDWEENLYAPGLSHANYDPLTGCLRQQRQAQFPTNNHMINNPYMQQHHMQNNFINQNYNSNYQQRNHNGNGGGPNGGGQFYNQGYSKQGNPEGNKRPRGGYRGSNFSENPQGKSDGHRRNNLK
ncbi:uncharacterized protein PGTG_03228 [Puccinia graminis f. sp. tritici CRL 75-36-700-3]|uniref:Uncharacterized protein n=1 Tax=Puccinia graminis f. sp. tritici (strain CRL 75-36-700-3 / race SCCL) TaxID=418459 RepID=E3JYZ7_PUCGT|nr:uncharacterized protein PGTG_03228 [Puccinia graminis f. sp. tritici CRL 75-36-700-3]EFP77272.2 hypothetical protein PGTG_03228 [Puccinia graminis f. sp. tritici CRL 75-36-700-3]